MELAYQEGLLHCTLLLCFSLPIINDNVKMHSFDKTLIAVLLFNFRFANKRVCSFQPAPVVIPGVVQEVNITVDTSDASLSEPEVVRLTLGPACPGHLLSIIPPPAVNISVVGSVVSVATQPEHAAQSIVHHKLVL